MKKFLSISLIFLLAFVIMYAGSGVNAYSFCCEDCHTFGIEAIIAENCCDIHHEDNSSEQNANDIDENYQYTHQKCSVERFNIDTEDISDEDNLSETTIKVLEALYPTLPYLSKQYTESEHINRFVTRTQKPPNMSEDVYFSLLETLII